VKVSQRNRLAAYLIGASATALGVAIGFATAKHTRRTTLDGNAVLITGGSRGLGLAMAREFARHGCKVAICARDPEELAKAVALLESEGVEAFGVPCDVSDPAQVDELVRSVRRRFGRIDILVNNAGEILVAPLENTTPMDFDRAMQVMFWGVLYPTLAVLPEMKARRSGRVAVITSIGGKVSVPHLLAYSCAKFAAVAFYEGLRAEMSSCGIHVTTIAPGLMRTGSHVNARFKGKRESEAVWFSVAATFPGLTMSAERAARQSVDAIRRGQTEKILSTQAVLLARLNGAFPGLVPRMMAVANRLLPGPTDDRQSELKGKDAERNRGGWFRVITTLGRRAGERLNQSRA
jgi:NAD(P)-dependent dehydrogenase (short-subunit alcohol dehydrogenase family)